MCWKLSHCNQTVDEWRQVYPMVRYGSRNGVPLQLAVSLLMISVGWLRGTTIFGQTHMVGSGFQMFLPFTLPIITQPWLPVRHQWLMADPGMPRTVDSVWPWPYSCHEYGITASRLKHHVHTKPYTYGQQLRFIILASSNAMRKGWLGTSTFLYLLSSCCLQPLSRPDQNWSHVTSIHPHQ